MQAYLFDDLDEQKLISRRQINLPGFPSTRYQGSKRKVLPALAEAFSRLNFQSSLDLYSGSGMVSLLLRYLGKTVDSNDCLLFNQSIARAFNGLTSDKLKNITFGDDLLSILTKIPNRGSNLVRDNYQGIFFTDEENVQIDNFCQNCANLDPLERDVLIYAVGQALMKKRPYNLFHRANLSMRKKDVKRSFGNAEVAPFV